MPPLHGQAQPFQTKRFQLKVACQTANCSRGAETQPFFQRCRQGGNFLHRGGVHSCGQKSFMFPWFEMPDLSGDCRFQLVPGMQVVEPPCRHHTYHEVLWKCFPREGLLRTLQCGLRFHADLAWKIKDLGNLALGQNLPSTLETSQVQPSCGLCLGLLLQLSRSAWSRSPLSQLLSRFFTLLQEKKKIKDIFSKSFLNKMLRNIKQRAPEKLSCTFLQAGALPAPACHPDGAVFPSRRAPAARPRQTCILFKTGCEISQVKNQLLLLLRCLTVYAVCV